MLLGAKRIEKRCNDGQNSRMGDCNVLFLVWEFAHMGVYSLETVIELYTYGFCIMFQ